MSAPVNSSTQVTYCNAREGCSSVSGQSSPRRMRSRVPGPRPFPRRSVRAIALSVFFLAGTQAAAQAASADAATLFNRHCLEPAVRGVDPEIGLTGVGWEEVAGVPVTTFVKKAKWLRSHRTWKRLGADSPIYISLLRHSGKSNRVGCQLRAVAGTGPGASLIYLNEVGFLPMLPRGVLDGFPRPSERRAGPSFRFAAKNAAGRRLDVEFMSAIEAPFADIAQPVLWYVDF